jgi:hypothetical protein
MIANLKKKKKKERKGVGGGVRVRSRTLYDEDTILLYAICT